MATKMDAAAAARAIRNRLSQPEAEDRHIEAFAKKVADHLGLDHSARNISMVVSALHREDIVPHEMQEYPKYIRRDGDDPDTGKPYEPVKVNDEIAEHDVRASWDGGERLANAGDAEQNVDAPKAQPVLPETDQPVTEEFHEAGAGQLRPKPTTLPPGTRPGFKPNK